MSPLITQIVNELLQMDPSLKKDREALTQVVKELLLARPEVSIDPEFYKTLHQEIALRLKKASRASSQEEAPTQWTAWAQNFTTLFQSKAVFAGAFGFALFASILGISSLLTSQSGIHHLGHQAFGSLTQNTMQGEKGGLEIGGNFEGPTEGTEGLLTPPEERINFEFTYAGEPLKIPENVEVLTPEEVSDFQMPTLDNWNPDAFDAMQIESLNLVPANGEGYSLWFEAGRSTLSLSEYIPISENCPLWGYCKNWDQSALTPETFPKDETLIAIAENFLKTFKLKPSWVGAPQVALSAEDLGTPEHPSEVGFVLDVSYPLEIEGKPVYWSADTPNNMILSIDAHRKKVTQAHNIPAFNRLEASSYPAASEAMILDLASTGGHAAGIWWENPTKTIQLSLGTPSLVYQQIELYRDSGSTRSFYVPAYHFPILEDETTKDLITQAGFPYYADHILVPIPKEMIEELTQKQAIENSHWGR